MKKISSIIVLLVVMFSLSGCNALLDELNHGVSSFQGLPMVVQTYDENSNPIDKVEGKSIDIQPDTKFAITDVDGNTVEKSSVLNVTIEGKQMMHVGSSLIGYETGLVNLVDEYKKTVDIKSIDSSIPFMNRMVNSLENSFTGQKMVILIRSQNGTPLATFAGNSITYKATGIDKSTSFFIDGKRLFVYRCDYTVYETDLLK